MSEGWVYNPNTPIHARRQFSPILAAFPWQWAGIVEEPKSLAEFMTALPDHSNFIASLHRYESHLFSFRSSQLPARLLTCLGVQLECPSSPRENTKISVKLPPELSVNDYLDISSLICSYRLFEIIALRANRIHPVPSSSPVAKLYLPPSKVKSNKLSLDGFNKLDDWPSLLFSFKTVVEKHNAKAKGPHFPPTGHPYHALLRMLGDNEVKGSYNAIENNFVRAAIHVAAMENIVFPEHMPPDLPSNLQLLNYRSNLDSETQNALGIDLTVPMAYQNEFRDDSSAGTRSQSQSTASLRNPLLLSSLLTPLYLAVQMLLCKKSFSRRSVLELAARLGPHRPPLLTKVEGLFFDALMRLSKGRTLPDRVLIDLVASIPWDEVETSQEKHWFSLEQRIRPVSSASYQTEASCNRVNPVLSSSQSLGHASVSTPLPSPAMSAVVSPPSAQSAAVNTRSSEACTSTVPEIEKAADLLLPTGADKEASDNRASVSPPSPLPAVPSVALPPIGQPAPVSTPLSDGCTSSVPEVEEAPDTSSVTDNGCNVATSVAETDHANSLTDAADQSPTANNMVIDNVNSRSLDTQLTGDSEPSIGPDILDFSSEGHNIDIDMASVCSAPSVRDNSESEHPQIDEEMLDVDDVVSSDLTDTDDLDDDSPSIGLPADPKTVSSKKSNPSAPAASKRSTRLRSSKAGGSAARSKQGGSLTASKQDSSGKKSKQSSSLTNSKENPPGKPKRDGSCSNNQDGVRNRKASKLRDIKQPFKDLHAGNCAVNPIDVDLFCSLFDPVLPQDYALKEEKSLSGEAPPARVISEDVYEAYDADGGAVHFKPEFHFAIYHTRFHRFMARVKDYYIDGKPRHVSAPLVSCIRIISFEIFKALPPNTLFPILAAKHIVVTDCPVDARFTFDEDGLCLLAPLESQVSINDFAIEPPNQTCRPAVVSGQVEDLLLNMGPTGRILNALDFPLSEPSQNTSSFSADRAAWFAVRGLYTTILGTLYPTPEMNWATAGHKNTLTLLHIDCDGLNTEDGPACGRKVWGLMSPRSDLPLSSTRFFLHGGFALDNVFKSSLYDFEAIVLRPGDRLFMKPGTPHFVFGLDDAICIGGHYYATCLMQDTLQALIHAFVLNEFLTNTSHQASRQLLRRILIFYHRGLIEGKVSSRGRESVHLPDIQNIDGILNLLSVVILVFLGNVLDFRTYSAPNQFFKHEATREQAYLMKTYDFNSITHLERQAMCYARGIALVFVRWIRAECVIKGPAGETVDDLPSAYIVQLLAALLDYKKSAEQYQLNGAPHCSLTLLTAQVENVVRCDAMLQNAWNNRPTKAPSSLALENKAKYSVRWKEDHTTSWRSQNLDFFAIGLTPFDQLYFQYQNGRGEDESTRVASEIESSTATTKKRKVL